MIVGDDGTGVDMAPDCEVRSKVVGSIPGYAATFQLWIAKQINNAISVRIILICSDHGQNKTAMEGLFIKVSIMHQHL